MKIHEAISYLEKVKMEYDCSYEEDALNAAIKSLEKETPRMVNYEGDGYADGYMVYDMAECPACGNRMDEDDVDVWEVAKYCPECGQRIIWEGENGEDNN